MTIQVSNVGTSKVALGLGSSSAGLHPASSKLARRYARLAQRSQRDRLCWCAWCNRLAALLVQQNGIASKSAITWQRSLGDNSKASSGKKRCLS
jgi:hypothetical protein